MNVFYQPLFLPFLSHPPPLPPSAIMLTRQVQAHGRISARVELAQAHHSITALTLDVENISSEPVYVFLASDIDRNARKLPARGELFCYMAVHPNSDRKKNTYLGVSKDPITDLYMHNHSDAFEVMRKGREPLRTAYVALGTKTTHAAAPYWSMNNMFGPLLTRPCASMAREEWGLRTRGDESKTRRARIVAKRYDAAYFGQDVPLPRDSVRSLIETRLGPEAGSLFDTMCHQLAMIDTTCPELAALDVPTPSTLTTLLGSAGHESISFVRPVY
jgi:hypothetical protein